MNISVIIPTLNEEEMIGRTVQEVRERSSGQVSEIIVVDGGSTDATRSEAKEVGAKVFKTRKQGRARQMNEGAKHATSEVLYFLHADSIPPNHFDRQIRDAINRGYPAGCFRLTFDSDHPLLNFYSWCTRFDLTAFRFGDQSLFVTGELFGEIGGFNDDLIVMEDNMIVRTIKKKKAFTIIPDNVVTSARKYERIGVIRLQLIFILIYMLFFVGLPQEVLVRTYKRLVQE